MLIVVFIVFDDFLLAESIATFANWMTQSGRHSVELRRARRRQTASRGQCRIFRYAGENGLSICVEVRVSGGAERERKSRRGATQKRRVDLTEYTRVNAARSMTCPRPHPKRIIPISVTNQLNLRRPSTQPYPLNWQLHSLLTF